MTPETITCAFVVLLLLGLAVYGQIRKRQHAPDDFVGEHMSHEGDRDE